jgi:hypothetical protein
MKLFKTASGKKQIKLSKKEWKDIGLKAGWIKEAKKDKSKKNRNKKNKGFDTSQMRSKKNKQNDPMSIHMSTLDILDDERRPTMPTQVHTTQKGDKGFNAKKERSKNRSRELIDRSKDF